VRVLLVAAESVLRQAVQLGLSEAADAEVEVVEPSPDQISQAVEGFGPDVLLVWLQDASENGGSLADLACRLAGDRPVLVLAADLPRHTARTLLVPGIAGYILTAGGTQEIARALRRVVAGGLGAGGMREGLARFRLEKPQRMLPSLSERQGAILGMVCQGLSYREIGRRLSVSPSLVRKEVRQLLELARARSRVELIARMGDGGEG